MQAIMILALIGVLLTTISVIATYLSQSAMIMKLNNIERTETIFRDIDLATNRLLMEYPTITAYDSTFSLTDLMSNPIDPWYLTYTAWQSSDLIADPWENSFTVRAASQTIALGASAAGPAYAVALGSPGPDKVWQTSLPLQNNSLTFAEVMNISPVDGSDDIIHTFSTRDTLNRNWSELQQAIEITANALERNFQDQYYAFINTIDAYYTANSDVALSPTYSIEEKLLGWALGLPNNCTSGVNCEMEPMPISTPGYPTLEGDLSMLSVEKQLTGLVSGFSISLVQESPCLTAAQCLTAAIRLQTTATPAWTVAQDITIDGRDIIIGID